MRELEKILEEIEQNQVMLKPFDEEDRPTGIINVDVVKEIIRKHMNGTNYPYITSENIESISSVSEEFLQDCKKVAKKYKRNNDGWIPVKDRLPEIFGKYWATIRYDDGRISEPVVVDFRGTKQKYVVDTPNGREYETWGIDSAFHGSRVIAWRPYYIPDPYRPERRNEE